MESKTKNKCPKVGLALSGGSALGIAHIGVIKCFREHEIPISCVAGTSAGAIAALGVAFDVPIEKMIETSKKMNWATISEFGHSKLGINSNKPMQEMIGEMVGNVKIEEALIPLAIVATNVDTGKEEILRHGDAAEAVMASTCLPVLFVPVEEGRKRLVDGGLVENLPLSPLKAMGAQIRIGVDLSHWRKYKKAKNVFDVITNSYGIFTQSQSAIFPERAEVLIEPHLEKYTSSDFEKVEELMEEGYKAAQRMMPEIKKHLTGDQDRSGGFFRRIINYFKS